MRFPRSSGILLHPISLASQFGIGELGAEAYRFLDFLVGASQRVWQVLPLGPTGYGDSPYQCFSAFAGNPLLISLERLVEEGLLPETSLQAASPFPCGQIEYQQVKDFKLPRLRESYRGFKTKGSETQRDAFATFCQQHSGWLDDYALYMAVKDGHDGAAWTDWATDISLRRPQAIAHWTEELATEIETQKFWQFQFFRQWQALKHYANEHGVRIMGDIPIYVAHDSADAWAHPELFKLDEQGKPTVVAGVPPDYFSATGQLWGNPIYRWDVMAESGFQWWIERIRATLEVVDMVRLDHFRGFQAYWEVPANEDTAINGRWIKGPGAALFEAVGARLGQLPIVAENLGVITPEVEAIRNQFGFPGMAILQFAFGADPQAPGFQPHSYPPNLVAYTGTHDNDTTVGWWTSSGGGDSTRTGEEIRAERAFALKYLDADGRQINWAFIRTLLFSPADTVIIPLQDLLGLGSEARMNLPGRASGNWRWRYTPETLTEDLQQRLRELTVMYGR